MKISKEFKYTLTFTEEEMRWFKSVIDYGWHRAIKHKNTPMTCYKEFLTMLKDKCHKTMDVWN